jgi:lysophospholipase L1-like esterase
MQIIIFGASTAYGAWDLKGGWVSRLRAELDKITLSSPNSYYMTYNLGISGNTSSDILERFDSELNARLKDRDQNDEIMILFSVGNNDGSTKGGNRIVSIPQFDSNITLLAEKALNLTRKVVFVSTFPADETKTMPVSWGDWCYKNSNLAEYRDSIKKMCKVRNILFIDVFGKFIKKKYQELLQDGLHPNSKGHQKIHKIVSSALRKSGYL